MKRSIKRKNICCNGNTLDKPTGCFNPTGRLITVTCFIFISIFYSGCQKIEYEQIPQAAYLRVFNSVWDREALEQDSRPAYFCMLLNPNFDAEGIPLGAEIVGDFLDKREGFAPPYPNNIGSGISVNNKDWPGRNPVPVAPVVNGFDLSSWGQVPSGKLRVVFMYRPRNETPFFSLGKEYRKDVLVDTTISVEAGEVYTMQALTLDFGTKRKGVLLRKENFMDQSFSDERVYVNFYNYSAKGFAEAPDREKKFNTVNYRTMFGMGLKDKMDVYYSIYTGKKYKEREWSPDMIEFEQKLRPDGNRGYVIPDADPGYDRQYLTTVTHNDFNSAASPYVSLPMWSAADTTGKIFTDRWQRFYFLTPGLDIKNLPSHYSEAANNGDKGGIINDSRGNYAIMNSVAYNKYILMDYGVYSGAVSGGANMPNLILSMPSGSYKMRSFATVSTVELINSEVYMMTLQRKYDPPKIR